METKIASIAKRCDRSSRSDVIGASRSDSPGASQMMTRRGVKGEAPPARHHRAIADAPPVFFNYPHASAIFIIQVINII